MNKINSKSFFLSLFILAASNTIFSAQDDFTFIVTADTHWGATSSLSDAKTRFPNASLICNSGDNSPTGNYKGWDGFKETVENRFGVNFPWFASPGNHNNDSPEDMEYIRQNVFPVLSTRQGISNFRADLPNESVVIKSFDIFYFSATQDERADVINTLKANGLGNTDIVTSNPLSANYFIWTNADMSLTDFSNILDTIDWSNCLSASTSMDSVDEVKNRIKILFMHNQISTFSFDYKNAHFIFLNLYYDDPGFTKGRIMPRTMTWLENDFAQNTKPVSFVFGHEPAYPWGNRHWGDGLDEEPAVRDVFLELMRKNNAVAYFCGHTHYYGRTKHNGVYDINGGEANNYYLAVSIKDNKVIFEQYSRDTARNINTFSRNDLWTLDIDNLSNEWKTMTPGPGGWVTSLAIDPNNSNRVLAGSDMFGTAVSMDGGLTWSPSYGFSMNEIESFFMPKHPYGGNIYYQYAATLGGVYESYDAGYNWQEKKNEGLIYSPYNPLDNWPGSSESGVTRPISCIASASYLYSASGSVRMQNASINSSTFGLIYKMNANSDSQTWNYVADLKTITGTEANIQHLLAQRISGQPDRLIVSLRNGGVWRSVDGGTTWTDTNLPCPGGQAFVMDSASNNINIIYVAAGEDGVYKTTDGGNSWTKLAVSVQSQVLAVATSNPNIIFAGSYAGGNRGVMKSSDAGVTWSKVFDAYNKPILPHNQGTTNIKYHALAIDPKNPNHVIVGDDVNLYVSFDGGVNWKSSGGSTMNDGDTWTASNFNGLCGKFVAFDANDKNHILFGAADGGLWQTNDNGETYKHIVSDVLGPNDDPGEVFTRFYSGAISFLNSNIMFVVGDINGDAADESGPLFKTTDKGLNWIQLNAGPFRSIEINRLNDNIILATSDGMIKKSVDGGVTFNNVSADIGAVRLSSDPLNTNVFYSTSSSGIYKSQDGGNAWIKIGGPNVWSDFGKVAVNPKNTNILYATSFSGFWKYNGTSWQMIKAIDYASDIAVGKDGTVYGATTSFPNHDKDLLTTGVWLSHDDGVNWYHYSEGMRIKRIPAINADRVNNRVIAAADGGFYLLERPDIEDYELVIDQKVNILDVQACVNHMLGVQTNAKADVNKDGKVDAGDMQCIAEKILLN